MHVCKVGIATSTRVGVSEEAEFGTEIVTVVVRWQRERETDRETEKVIEREREGEREREKLRNEEKKRRKREVR